MGCLLSENIYEYVCGTIRIIKKDPIPRTYNNWELDLYEAGLPNNALWFAYSSPQSLLRSVIVVLRLPISLPSLIVFMGEIVRESSNESFRKSNTAFCSIVPLLSLYSSRWGQYPNNPIWGFQSCRLNQGNCWFWNHCSQVITKNLKRHQGPDRSWGKNKTEQRERISL